MISKLLVINLKMLFATMFRSSRRKIALKSGTKAGPILLVIFIGLSVVMSFGLMFFQMFSSLLEPFYSLGIGWLYFSMNGVMVFSICAVTCIFTAQSQIFKAKDNELLLSMPIRPSTILLSRILTLLVYEYVFEALISIPALIVWIVGGYSSPLGIVFFAIEFILLPLLALAVACLLAWILTIVTGRMRKSNVVTLLISIGFLAAYFWVFGNVQRHINTFMEHGAEIAEAFKSGFPPIFYMGRAVSDANPLDLLIFVACAVIPFAVIIGLLSHSFIRVATTKRGAKKIEYRAQSMKSSSHILALNKKELLHYWSNPNLVLNMSLGGVFAIVAGVFVLAKRTLVLDTINQITVYIPGITPALIVAAALAMTASMNLASASLISLEGKTLWIVRSSPIRGRDALLAKLLMHMEVSALPGLIASILCIIALFTRDPSGALAVVLLPFVFTLLSGLGGLILNLLFPKFDWLNEVVPAKQGLPVMLTMFGTMALVIGLALLYMLLLSSFMSVTAFMWVLIGFFAVLDAALYAWLITAGSKRFEALEG